MVARARWALALFLPVFGLVLLAVRTAWMAHVHGLNETDLHLQVFEHATVIVATLWALTLALAVGIAWWAAGYVASRRSGHPR